MKIVEGKQAEYEAWKAKQGDPYGARIFSYGEDLADMMEKTMVDEHVDESDPEAIAGFMKKFADPLSRLADTDGITGYMYGASVSVLSESWVHGDQLRRWHNLKTQIRNEGEKANETGGTLNPAILTIKE